MRTSCGSILALLDWNHVLDQPGENAGLFAEQPSDQAGSFQNLIFKGHAFRIVLLEPSLCGARIGEHLDVVGVVNGKGKGFSKWAGPPLGRGGPLVAQIRNGDISARPAATLGLYRSAATDIPG